MEKIQQWIETAAAQLRCRKAVPGVKSELESHLYEQYNAFLEQGCTAGEAQRKTVESMGDPVLAGGALDRIHRPRPAWGPFCAAAALLMMGGILRWWQSIPLAADGTLLWQESAWQTLFVTEISVLVLALVHFCMDVSLLARWVWQFYFGLLACSGCGILLGNAVINGRRYWALPFFGLYGAFDLRCCSPQFMPPSCTGSAGAAGAALASAASRSFRDLCCAWPYRRSRRRCC